MLQTWADPEPSLGRDECRTFRPCRCGCDLRGGRLGVGYLRAIRNGAGFSLWLPTEAEYQALRAVFGGQP